MNTILKQMEEVPVSQIFAPSCEAKLRTHNGRTWLEAFLKHAGRDRAHHGRILARTAALAEQGRLRPWLGEQRFSVADLSQAYTRVEAGSPGKVVIEIAD